jgi:hypothetical protein
MMSCGAKYSFLAAEVKTDAQTQIPLIFIRHLPLDDFRRLGNMSLSLQFVLLDGSSAQVGEPGSTGFFIPHAGKAKKL